MTLGTHIRSMLYWLHQLAYDSLRTARTAVALGFRGGPGDAMAMSLDRLKWLTIILPLIFVAVIQFCVMLVLEPGLEITSLQGVQKILRSIVERSREMLGSETAALCLAGGNGGGLTLVDCSGRSEEHT